MFAFDVNMPYCTKCGIGFQGESIHCESCAQSTHENRIVNSQNESTFVQKMVGIEPMIQTLKDPKNRKFVITGGVVLLLLAVILPTQTTFDESDEEIRIRWTNVQNCDFSIVLDSGDGRMYNKWVDSWDSVWWTPEEPIDGPFTFTITNLESSKECYTIHTLIVYGEEEQASVYIPAGDSSTITIQ